MPWLSDLKQRLDRGDIPVCPPGEVDDSAKQDEADRERAFIASRLQPRGAREFLRLWNDNATAGEVWRQFIALIQSPRWKAERPSFLLSGPRGTGKTTCLSGAGVMAIREGRGVWYLPITRMSRVIKAPEGSALTMAALEAVPLLLLDELHRFDKLPGWIQSEVVALIDHRYGCELQTGAAGTLNPGPLAEVIGKEIVERFNVKISGDEPSFRQRGKGIDDEDDTRSAENKP